MALKKRKRKKTQSIDTLAKVGDVLVTTFKKRKRKREKAALVPVDKSPGQYDPGFRDWWVGPHRVRIPNG